MGTGKLPNRGCVGESVGGVDVDPVGHPTCLQTDPPRQCKCNFGVPFFLFGGDRLSESLVHPRGDDVGSPIRGDGDLLSTELAFCWWERDGHDPTG